MSFSTAGDDRGTDADDASTLVGAGIHIDGLGKADVMDFEKGSNILFSDESLKVLAIRCCPYAVAVGRGFFTVIDAD
jgi:hypothetical protein